MSPNYIHKYLLRSSGMRILLNLYYYVCHYDWLSCLCSRMFDTTFPFSKKNLSVAYCVSEQHVLFSAKPCVDRVATVSCSDEDTGYHQWTGSCYLRRPCDGVFHLSCCLWSRAIRNNVRCTDWIHCSSQPHTGVRSIIDSLIHLCNILLWLLTKRKASVPSATQCWLILVCLNRYMGPIG